MSFHKRKTSLTAEEKEAYKVTIRRRLRALFYAVFNNKYWLENLEGMELGDDVRKNVRILTASKHKKCSLSVQDKGMLCKPKENRSYEEKVHLNRVIGKLKCFRRYTPQVTFELTGVTYFGYCEPDKILVRQGDEAMALYFILSGQVAVFVRSYDCILDEMITEQVGVMGTDEMVGEVSLLHGIPRTATIKTLTHCEFCVIKRVDFDAVLKSTVLDTWNEIRRFMSMFEYFNQWDDVTIRECCILAKTVDYRPKEMIFGDGVGLKNYAYFIVKGRCEIIEHVQVIKYKFGNKWKYKLYSEDQQAIWTPSSGTKRPEGLEDHFVTICCIKKLGCFNFDENLTNRIIVAERPVKCLLIPKYWLDKRCTANIWNRIRDYLNSYLPPREDAFNLIVMGKQWREYKTKLFKDIKGNSRKVTGNCNANIPYSLRLQTDIDFFYSN